jgi:hypothetical protein
MKNTLLFFLFLFLVLIMPTISVGAETHTMEVEFSFTAPDDPAKQLLGYRLYKEGEQVCETSDPNTSKVTCEILTEDGTFDFTLTAYYADSTESPASPSFPFTIASAGDTGSTPDTPSDPGTTEPEPPTDGTPTLPDDSFNIEIGTVSIDHEWVKVLFENTFSQPIVVASPPTINGSNPSVVRIRNIDQEGFEIRIQEWDYLDGWHMLETVSYVVIEKGAYTLDNGTRLEAGSFSGSTSFQQVTLQQAYNFTPVILTQVMTGIGPDAITNRLGNANQISFNHKLQEQETTQTAHPAVETIGYIAWEPGQGEVFGILYETGMTDNSVDHDWFDLTFETDFPDLPFFFSGIQTTYGNDTATVRTQNMSQTATQLKIEEEKSLDSEMRHTTEVMGYFTLGSATAATE